MCRIVDLSGRDFRKGPNLFAFSQSVPCQDLERAHGFIYVMVQAISPMPAATARVK